MKIDIITKYNCNDIVYSINKFNKKIIKTKIDKINIDIREKKINISYILYNMGDSYKEEDIFTSIEELKHYFINEINEMIKIAIKQEVL